MSTKRCPDCNEIIRFVQCHQICVKCKWQGNCTDLIDDSPVIDTINITIDEALAKAIVDMENIGFNEGLGPQSKSGNKKWNELVQLVVERFNLQDSCYSKNGE